MKIGVLFPYRFEDPGEFLADAGAMETAGVDSVWLEEANDGLDPLMMLAAIAAVTSQLRLGLLHQFPSLDARDVQGKSPSPAGGGGQGGGVDQRRLNTQQQLTRNREGDYSSVRWQPVDVH